MQSFFKKAWNWLVKSSADPKRTSLMVKGVGMVYVAYALQALGLACQYGYQCDFDSTLLTDAVNAVADMVFFGLTFAGAASTVYGVLRKIWRSATGSNLSNVLD